MKEQPLHQQGAAAGAYHDPRIVAATDEASTFDTGRQAAEGELARILAERRRNWTIETARVLNEIAEFSGVLCRPAAYPLTRNEALSALSEYAARRINALRD
jgi:hypothetical protein